MQFFKAIVASVLVPVGLVCLLAIATELINPSGTFESKLSVTVGGLILGLPALGFGGWMAWDWYQQRRKKIRSRSRRIQAIFNRLIQENQGTISVKSLSQYTHLSPFEAKQFLDQKAQELNGTLEKQEINDFIYRFY